MTDNVDLIREAIQKTGLTGNALKAALAEVVGKTWPDLPPWSTLAAPVIEEVQKATVGCGVVLTFLDKGVRKVVLGQAGGHYKNASPAFTIPGGFINLSETPGSALVPASNAPEDPRVGVARETEEEFRNPDGSPLLQIDPARLKPMDTKTIRFRSGEVRVVNGMMLELNADEVAIVQGHAAKLSIDPAYKNAVAAQSINHESGLPEIDDVKIFNLADVTAGARALLHKDQQSLFERVEEYFSGQGEAKLRNWPARTYQKKVMTLPELEKTVAGWRKNGAAPVGITSGAFDIVHPGHTSFLEDASRHCGRLIVVVASDRTIRELKGHEKPYISQEKRAEVLAAMQMVDAVIISDEFFHESILAATAPDILFKGDDYAGQKIMGADQVGRVVLIPCAEKVFYSSSAFARKIKQSGPEPV